MASNVSIAIACENACEQIDQYLKEAGLDVPPLPRINRHRELLRKIQLETIAQHLAQLQASKPKAKAKVKPKAKVKHHANN